MPDLEDRLRRSLREHAGAAPAAHDLAPAARARLRRRRTARAVVAVVAVLAVAVPVGVQALVGRDPHAAPPVTAPTVKRPPVGGFSPAPAGWRWETGNGLQALVPDTWGYGVDLADPCNRQVDPGAPGAVEVPGVHQVHACRPLRPGEGLGRYLAFGDVTPAQSPARSVVGRWTTVRERVGLGVVTVQDDDPVELRRILRSVSAVHRVDHDGCPLTPPRPRSPHGTDGGQPDVVVVCRYGGIERSGTRLSFSTVLDPARAARVSHALATAPRLVPQTVSCLDVRSPLPGTLVRERLPRGWRTYDVQLQGCPPGIDDGTTTRRVISREVARAVLIGYRGPVDVASGDLVGNWLRDNRR